MKKYLLLLLISFFYYGDNSDYVFGWTHLKDPILKNPRGGTTAGPQISLDDSPNKKWERLQDSNLSKFEKDRLAILAMQGKYRVYFDFMETVGFTEDYKPQQPYQTWGKEFVIVLEEQENFISLQHIMVMYFQQDDGSISEPYIVKHWRQDWKYQDNQIHSFSGNNTWKKEMVSWNNRKCTWSQSVYQVDDSPRYQSYGKWEHYDNFSSWTSNETWRPLPRRESTIRDDYDVMIGTNIQTITPDGWVHEQNNKKVNLSNNSVLAKEIGLARYERIKNFNWAPGETFWQNTEDFWKEVRKQWNKKLDESNNFKLIKEIDGQNLFMRLFELSDRYEKGNKEAIKEIASIVEQHSEI